MIDQTMPLDAFLTVKPALSGHSKRRPEIGFQDRLSLNVGQKYCRMLLEHSAILLAVIKLSFVFKTFVLSIFEWLLKTVLLYFSMLILKRPISFLLSTQNKSLSMLNPDLTRFENTVTRWLIRIFLLLYCLTLALRVLSAGFGSQDESLQVTISKLP